jgi:hypothetical protein
MTRQGRYVGRPAQADLCRLAAILAFHPSAPAPLPCDTGPWTKVSFPKTRPSALSRQTSAHGAATISP